MNKRVFSLAMLAASLPAIAQQDTTKNLDPVTVTANKIEQKQSTTGKVVTVITKEQLEKSSGKTVSQVLNEQAGLLINGAYNNLGSVQTVYMRGASPGRVLILMDGVPVNDPSFINNEYDLNFFSINEVERIEVCRGAQSTLYGSDAVAGVINIITIDKDVKKPFNVKATAAYGSFNTFKGNVQFYGKKNKFTYNLRYARLSTDGFSSAYDSTGTNNFDKDAYKGNVVSASAQYQFTNQVSVRAFSQYSGYKSDIDASIFNDEKDYFIDNSAHTSGVSFNYKADKVTLTANYQYANLKRTYRNDSSWVDPRPFTTIFENNAYKGRTQFFELFASINLGSGFTLLQGGDYRYGMMNNDYLSISSFGPYATKFRDTSVSQTSIYASLMYGSKDKKFNAELGGRLNVHSRYGSNHTYTFNPTYKITEHYRIFGSIATGFKAPSIYQVYDQSAGNRSLKPEQSTNYELGFSEQHEKVRSRLVYFYREIKDGVDFNYVTFKYFNFVKQIVRGLEYEISYQPIKGLSISGNYTYISSQENTQSRINFKDTSYTYLLRRPKHNINLNIGFQFTDKFFTSVNGKYVSSRQDVGGYQKADVYLKSYYVMSAYAEYKFKHFKFFADAQNVTDNKFFDIRGYNAMPFMVTGGVTFTW